MNKRFNIDWDNELTQEQLINLILTDEDLPKLRSLTIGNWGDCWEDETCQPIIDMIVENAPAFLTWNHCLSVIWRAKTARSPGLNKVTIPGSMRRYPI